MKTNVFHLFLLLLYLRKTFGSSEFVKLRIPNYATSFCTNRMNFSHYFGCSSQSVGSVGTVLVVRTLNEMQFKLSEQKDEKFILVLPASMFTKRSTIQDILDKRDVISGIVVFEPIYCSTERRRECRAAILSLREFSEENICTNYFYRHFNQKSCYYTDIFGYINLYKIQWPFPMVFLKSKENYQQSVIDCYEIYNTLQSKHNKCKIRISSYTQRSRNVARCFENNELLRKRFWLTSDFHFCTDLSGNNIYLTFNPSKRYLKKSIILITTRMDTKSLFDTAAAGTHEIYPSIAILVHMSSIFKESKFIPNVDILVGFLDNESNDNLGSLRMIYDLKTNQVSNGVGNISDENIVLIISLENFTFSKFKRFFLFFYKCENDPLEVCKKFLKIFRDICKKHQFSIAVYKIHHTDIWQKIVKVPKINIRTEVVSSAKYRSSFLDRMKPLNTTDSHKFAALIAAACLQFVNGFGTNITFNNQFMEPVEIAYCLFSNGCRTLTRIIGQREKLFYSKYGSPLVAQSFVDGFVQKKHGKYINRLSYFVLKILLFNQQRGIGVDPDCMDMQNLNNFTMVINDVETCIQAYIQVRNDFNPVNYVRLGDLFFNILSDMPLWMRSNVVMEQKVLLFVSVDYASYSSSLLTALLIAIICATGSLFIHKNIDLFIPHEIF